MTGQRLDEQVAIVTGGSNGIGRATTQALVEAGASVVVCEVADAGYFADRQEVLTITGDVADTDLAERAVSAAVFAMELGAHGIRVNVVAPGYIDVRGWSDAYPDRAPEELRLRSHVSREDANVRG